MKDVAMALSIKDAATTSKWDQPRIDILGDTKDQKRSVKLHMDWLNYSGALHACRSWHYTATMPASKTIKVGVWERGSFIGCVIFSRGANPRIGRPFGLKQTEICELTRIALRHHKTPVSKLISFALRMLKQQSPGLRLVVSYADTGQGHIGTVYQAANWTYIGEASSYCYMLGEEIFHPKTIGERAMRMGVGVAEYIKQSGLDFKRVNSMIMHKYAYPLDKSQIDNLEGMALPYPKH